MTGETIPTQRKPEIHVLAGTGELALKIGTPPGNNEAETSTALSANKLLSTADGVATGTASQPPAGTGESPGAPAMPDTASPEDEKIVEMKAEDKAALQSWELVQQAQQGDDDAFARLYRQNFDAVYRFIYFRTGQRELAEDLASDTFLRAFQRISSFTWQGKSVGAWLITIAHNLVADYYKSGRRRLELNSEMHDINHDRADPGPEGNPEMATISHLTNLTLLDAVKKLNPEQQQCIILRFLNGLSVAETAQMMGKNEGAIKALQYRAVHNLHKMLKPESIL